MPTDDGEEEDDDPDVKSDPINETNMRVSKLIHFYLNSFTVTLKLHCSWFPGFRQFVRISGRLSRKSSFHCRHHYHYNNRQ